MFTKLLHNFIFDVIGSYVTWWFFKVFCKGTVNNLAVLEDLKAKPYIVALNHTSHFDWFLLFPFFNKVLKRKISFLAKKELFQSQFWKPFMQYSGSIGVDREKVSSQLLRELVLAIRAQRVIGIFPEGTRSLNGKLLRGKDGIVRIAMFLDIPVVPIGLTGFHNILPKGKHFPRPARCSINIGEPMHFDAKQKDFSHIGRNTELVMKKIAELSNQQYSFTHAESQ